MRLSMIAAWGFALLVLAAGAAPRHANAHGTAHRVLQDPKIAAVEFYFSDHTPMQYAAVLVFSPADRKIEHQNARTDKNGRFAFCPDAPGTWIVDANDGMGHKERAEVVVQAPEVQKTKTPPATQPAASKTMGIIAGLSLILNLFLAVLFWKQRSRSAAA